MNKEQLELFDGVDGIYKIEQKENVTFMHADNLSFLRKCKEEMLFKHFHVGIVDPPYGISVGDMKLGATANSKPREYEMGKWDNEVPTQEYWDLLWYCCRDLIIWGGNYFTDKYGTCTKNDIPNPIIPGRCFYVWDKLNNGMSFADCELALTTFDSSARIIPKSRSLKGGEGDKRHPTHKPSYLYEYLHNEHDLRGKKVLDTHGGSFSHAIASFRTGALLTIMDREESYFKSGINAFDNDMNKQRTLF